MDVECTFFGPLREAVGEKSVTRTVPEGATVGDLLAGLVADHPELSGQLLAAGDGADGDGANEAPDGDAADDGRADDATDDRVPAGEIADGVNVTLNGTDVRHLDGAATALSDGDVVRAAPPVVGG